MAKYKLIAGKHDDKKPGAIVELTDSQYENFKDKFEPVGKKAEVEVEEEASATQPPETGKSTEADKAPAATAGATGAGAAANSTNVKKV